jgi:hypothetical protein
MNKWGIFRPGWRWVISISIVTMILGSGVSQASAQEASPPGPNRFAEETQDYTAYVWWLSSWANNSVLCTMKLDRDGMPSNGDIYSICGKAVYDKWSITKTCPEGGICRGYYLQFVKTEPATRKVKVTLPPPQVWLSVDGCEPWNSSLRCEILPRLILTGEEPLEGQTITGVNGWLDGIPFTCEGICQLDLNPTGVEGMSMEFWASSSYGDSSVLFSAKVRVTVSDNPDDLAWYVDVISTQWQGAPMADCGLIWQSFPPVGGPPGWLAVPSQVEQLATDRSYGYLAAHLINSGVVDISGCADGGIQDNGLASPCGLEASHDIVRDWQNRFDQTIFTAGQDAGVSASLLKAIFARESQFWPGISAGKPEAGLGQMTENGADTTLLWNHPFFNQFCSTVLDPTSCKRGYPLLQPATQTLLRTRLVQTVNGVCSDCALGIDMNTAESSINVFANMLQANCTQTGMLIHNTYGGAAGDSASYEDLWRFTLVNYNAGAGCLTLALREARKLYEPLDWQHLSSHFTKVCSAAIDYVETVSNQLSSPGQ